MNSKVNWHNIARQDLAEAYLYIGERSPDSAERLLDAVDTTIAFLLANPRAGSPRHFRDGRAEGVRSRRLEGFRNYLIFYRAVEGGIEVIRFLHGARDLPALFEE